MGLADAVIAAVILAGALFLLYRSLWKGGGGSCHGCDGGSCRPSSRGQAGLVRLGGTERVRARKP
jgi:hypothetical protein